MDRIQILWADDEIDLLKPHLLFLKEKGYDLITANSGDEALELIEKHNFDVVLLDENMPGLSGLETLNRLKAKRPDLPVIMITKSEEEHLMENAIGSKISDYLIKPVNPNQILLSLKKTLDNKRLISEKTTSNYQQEFRQIGMMLSDKLSWNEWVDVYKKLVYWEIELDKSKDESMMEILKMQKSEANKLFCKFVENNYLSMINGKSPNPPLFSHTVVKAKVAPMMDKSDNVFLILIDNLRYDQWKIIQPIISEYFTVDEESVYSSILPTATEFARNAFFAGLMPSEIEKRFPNMKGDGNESSLNMYEQEFLFDQMKRLGKNAKTSYNKITNHTAGKKLSENMNNLWQNKLNVIVYNFVDILSHARSEMEIIRELADDERAYRSITLSWFENSPLQDIIRQIADKKCKLIITTDHGTIRVTEPSKMQSDRTTNSNLRYKSGRAVDFEKKDVFEVKNPADAYLPKEYVSSSFVFAKESKFFAYPNNYNTFVNHYKNTFQHGGISMEEMIIPFVTLSAK